MNLAESMTKIGIEFVQPPRVMRRFNRLLWLFTNIIALKPSIIYAHSVLPSLYVRLVTWWSNIPVVSVLHDASQDDYANRIYRWPEQYLLRVPAAVVTVAPEAAVNYMRRTKYQGMTLTIPNGVPMDEIRRHSVNRSKVRNSVFKLYDDFVPVVLQVGRINPEKAQLKTLLALESLALRGKFSGRLVYVGLWEDDEYVAQLTNAIQKSPLRDNIQLFAPRTDIYDLLAAADIYTMPSVSEAFSVAFIEALASGITVVGADIAAFQFARSLPGVNLYTEAGEDSYASTFDDVLAANPVRFERVLGKYDITNTVKSYSELTEILVNWHVDAL